MQSSILEIYPPLCTHTRVSLVAQLVKNPPAIQETWVRSLSWEDPLEKGKATHSSILACRIPWTRVHGVAKSQTQLSNFHSLHTHLQGDHTDLLAERQEPHAEPNMLFLSWVDRHLQAALLCVSWEEWNVAFTEKGVMAVFWMEQGKENTAVCCPLYIRHTYSGKTFPTH